MTITYLQNGQAARFPLIVHSHLRWDFVWQRPQQILSRLAQTNPVLFVEEPVFEQAMGRERLELTEPYAKVVRAVPHLPESLRNQYDKSALAVRALLRQVLARGSALDGQFREPVQWFYTPMPAPVMLGQFNERGVVYDCMDELAQFRHAPPDILKRERLLLSTADVVFTGGYKLYQSKTRYHDNVHFFGCGVDVSHFGKARLAETVVPDDVSGLKHPIMGYFGVIDERLDYALLGRLAVAYPEWSLVMVGPVVKVDPSELPRAENIHWLGQRDYSELPTYVKSFDVCLMPFALNEATEYINPTKTLEYMAAGKPIVSTTVADVVRNFTPIVQVAHTQGEFIRAVAKAIRQPNAALIAEGVERAGVASWNAIVATMERLVLDALLEPETATTATGPVAAAYTTEIPANTSV